jgi:hypothetical protein
LLGLHSRKGHMICDEITSTNRKGKNAWEIPLLKTYLTRYFENMIDHSDFTIF